MSVATVLAGTNQQILTYLPTVAVAVQAAEALAPEGATGAQKLDAVVTAVSGQLASTPGVNPNVATIALTANIVVSLLHAFGVFKHKDKAA